MPMPFHIFYKQKPKSKISVTSFVCDAVFALGRYILCDKSYLLLFSFLKLGTFHEI